MEPIIIFQIIILIYSIIIHEIAYGYSAYLLGDKTAFYMNRLTLNPIPHIDFFGSILLPFILIISGGGLVAGFAKPVPVNENDLQKGKLGKFIVSFAGVFINILLVIIFAIIGKMFGSDNLKLLAYIVANLNLGLAIFNLLPIPPADGYRIISLLLPNKIAYKIEMLIRKYMILSLLLAIYIASIIFSYIYPIFNLFLKTFIFN